MEYVVEGGFPGILKKGGQWGEWEGRRSKREDS